MQSAAVVIAASGLNQEIKPHVESVNLLRPPLLLALLELSQAAVVAAIYLLVVR